MILVENLKGIELTGNELKNYRQKKKILHLLYENETLSATSIAKQIGVSLPTSLALLKDLSLKQFVEVRGSGKSKGGRRPTMFGLQNSNIFIVACELGRFKGKIGIYDSHNNLVAPVTEFNTSIDDKDLADKIYKNTQQIIDLNGIDAEHIYGVGLAMPGLVDSEEGINYTIKNKAYRNIQEHLEKKFNKLTYVNNSNVIPEAIQ